MFQPSCATRAATAAQDRHQSSLYMDPKPLASCTFASSREPERRCRATGGKAYVPSRASMRTASTTIKRSSAAARGGAGTMSESTRDGRAGSRGNGKDGKEGWTTYDFVRLTAVCAVCAFGVVKVVPGVMGTAGISGDGDAAVAGMMFQDVLVPAETVPVSIGIAIGSAAAGQKVDAQVHMCHLDRDTYFHQPYKYPMFKDLVKLSGGCAGSLSTVTSLSNLQAVIDANPEGYLEPTGFVFHMSRCGSTLTANLMGSSPYNLVYSESQPPPSILGLCDTLRCSEQQRVDALRTIIRAMGKSDFHKHVFFKFQSSQSELIPLYRKAFPNTPWVFVYRDPVPVLMSLLGFRDGVVGKVSSRTPCLRTQKSPPKETARLMGMTKNQAKHAPSELYCAAHLAALVSSALHSMDEADTFGEAGGHAVDYDTLPYAIVPVMKDLFNAPLTIEEENYALEISGWYAKSRNEVVGFSPDTKDKEAHASSAVVQAAQDVLMKFYDRLHAASLPKDKIPTVLAEGYVPPTDRREMKGMQFKSVEPIAQLTDEEFEAIPAHLRGLDRVVDPEAPDFMASSAWKSMPIEEFECPDEPAADYPKGYPAMDVIHHWNPDDSESVPPEHYLSTCRFDYQRELAKAERYSKAEKPFILYNIPSVDATAGRWSNPLYMEKIFGAYTKYPTEHSTDNHFMYYNHKLAKQAQRGAHQELNLTDWKPPTDSVNLSYREWLKLAKKHGKGHGEHWYFRVGDANNKPRFKENLGELSSPKDSVSGLLDDMVFCRHETERVVSMMDFVPKTTTCQMVVLNEMEIFQTPPRGKGNIFLVQPAGQRGIHCRFGMPGVIAEAHFDGSRNMVAMISGVRRWIMAHPNQCDTMYLLPNGHPSGRHSDVDWSNPDLEKFPRFPQTLISEVLLKAGEVLYVPTQWFHYISNIGINAQCNSRSGISMDYDKDLEKCGFGAANSKSHRRGRGSRRLSAVHDEDNESNVW